MTFFEKKSHFLKKKTHFLKKPFFLSRYTVLFKNARDSLSIQVLAKQAYPKKPQAFMEAYENLTRLPFSYMVILFYQRAMDNRLLTIDHRPMLILSSAFRRLAQCR